MPWVRCNSPKSILITSMYMG